jgi:hypothetical protein
MDDTFLQRNVTQHVAAESMRRELSGSVLLGGHLV